MVRSSINLGTLSFGGGGGGGGGRASGLWAGSVHGGAGGYGIHVSQASQPWLVGASRAGVGGGFSSSVGVGSGLGVGYGAGLGAGHGVGFGTGFKSGGAFSVGAGFGGGDVGETVGILGNEKFTMRFLNDRLATYLKKVQLLEKANADLELKIKQFVDNRTSPTARDYSDSLVTITDLQDKILKAIQLKATVQINLDNTTLAADDFRIKYENELAMRLSVEADIAGLKKLLDEINLSMKELTLHISTLKDEIVFLKKNHEEEMVTTRSQMSGQIHVEVETVPQENLTSVLEDIRAHYETIAAKNRREVEAWFKGKLKTLKEEVSVSATTTETAKTEMITQKTKVQNLELELQSVLAVKASLGAKLLETQAFYTAHMSGYQLQVTSLEEQLLQLRADLERQGRDYQMLLDIKTRLEQEITEYRRLLDVGASGIVLVATDSSSVDKRSAPVDVSTAEEQKEE